MFNLFKKSHQIKAPINGTVISLEDINDPVFSKKIMGDGAAIKPTGDTIYSPINATVTLIAETKHAIGLLTNDGLEILIHVGLDTVFLKGEGFTPLVKANQKVTTGTPLLKINRALMEEKGANLITPIIITNTNGMALSFENINANVEANKDVIISYK